MSEEESKHLTNEDDDERHRREEAERRAKRKVWFHVKYSTQYTLSLFLKSHQSNSKVPFRIVCPFSLSCAV